jgi:hypothetical protein
MFGKKQTGDPVVQARLEMIERELVLMRVDLERIQNTLSAHINGQVSRLLNVISAETISLQERLDAMHARAHAPAAPPTATASPLSALSSLFDELPPDDPHGLKPEDRLLAASYKERE